MTSEVTAAAREPRPALAAEPARTAQMPLSLFALSIFYGVFPIGELLLGQMLAKVVLSAVLVPPLVYAFVGLGRRLDQPR